MASNVRFVDSLKVGAYTIEVEDTGSNIVVENNVKLCSYSNGYS